MPGGYAARAEAARARAAAHVGESRVIPGSRRRHARDASLDLPNPGTHVMYYLFAPQGSGEAESLTPLKRRTTPIEVSP